MAQTAPSAKVRDVMSHTPLTIGPRAAVADASRLLREAGIRHLPVVDEIGRLVGVISERDLRCAAFAPAVWQHLSPAMQARLEGVCVALERVKVSDLMSPDPVTITPDAPLAEAAARMFEHRFGCLPVVEHGRLAGLVTEADALAALADLLQPRARLEVDWLVGSAAVR